MTILNLCSPAIIYILFSIVQIVVDIFNDDIEIALTKVFIVTIITFLLQLLCRKGLGIISWIIVFIPIYPNVLCYHNAYD